MQHYFKGKMYDSDLELLKAQKIDKVKTECRKLIEGLLPRYERFERQTKLVQLGGLAATTEKYWEIEGLAESYRAQSNEMEAEIEDMDAEELEYFYPEFITATPTEPTYTKLSKRAFLSRFTGDEYKAIMESDVGQVMLLRDMLKEAQFIDVAESMVQAGLGALETVGILASGRVAEMLQTGTEAESAFT